MSVVVDMTTTDGLVEHLSDLPTENLQAIERRPVWNAESALMVTAAAMILTARQMGIA